MPGSAVGFPALPLISFLNLILCGAHEAAVDLRGSHLRQRSAAILVRRFCRPSRIRRQRSSNLRPMRVRNGRGTDFAVTKAYALQGDSQVLLVSTDDAGLGF